MPSLIPGFEYDIFISYRQKDNRHDGWVTEFVDNLKGELESTFKEEISVYFDINPHDGLLENHDVDASLKEKLKCLIFIPIISRTYCDPKSFAWEHEFKAFIEQASKDQYGLKVKLPNGNVANRVLPVLIHDLDTNDVKLCESVLGGLLRGIEFIYKEPGVNRSLIQADDIKNLNNTRYRNQINKVALAAREIILGLRTESGVIEKEYNRLRILDWEVFKEKNQAYKDNPVKLNSIKFLSGIAVLTILIIAAILVYINISNSHKPESRSSSDKRISLVIMPFQNMTNDTIWNVWQEGIQSELINFLTNFKGLMVRQVEPISGVLARQGIANYPSLSPSLAAVISKKLDAGLFLYGSIKQAGDVLRVTAQLINTKTEEMLKSFSVEGPAGEKIIFHIIDSLSSQIKNFLLISESEKEVSPGERFFISTNSPEAYRYYLYGQKALLSSGAPSIALNWYSRAVDIDSNFIAPAVMLVHSYNALGMPDKAREWLVRLYKKRDVMPIYSKLLVEWNYSINLETPTEALKYITQLQEMDDQINLHYNIGVTYMNLHQYDKAISEFEKNLDMYNKWGLVMCADYTALGEAYHQSGQYRKEMKLYKQAEKLFPENAELNGQQALLSLSTGDTISANRYIEKWISIRRDASDPEVNIVLSLGRIYYNAGSFKKSEEYFRKALSMQPDNPEMISALAWFLIDKDRNVNEGLELNERALALNPKDYKYLANKGWGYYKQGKLKESLETLEKAWDLRDRYNPDLYSCIQKVKNAIAAQKY